MMTLSLSNCPIAEFSPLGILRSSYRVQRIKSSKTTVVHEGFLLPPRGLMTGRFDVPDVATAYFAASMSTAILESVARRNKQAVALADLMSREIVCVQQIAALKLLDTRGMERDFQDLVADRYSRCQRLALEAYDAGLDGVIYASAQHPESFCFSVFELQLDKLRIVKEMPMVRGRDKRLLKVVQETLESANFPVPV
jgi:RES domain-containing protein